MYTVLYTVLVVKRKIEVKEVPASAFEDYRLGKDQIGEFEEIAVGGHQRQVVDDP